MRYVEKQVVLQALDHLWREHLVMLDHLRQVIGWRGMAQRDPLNEYKSEAFELFNALITQLREADDGAADAGRGRSRTPPPSRNCRRCRPMHFDPLTGEDELAPSPRSMRRSPPATSRRARSAVDARAAPARDPNDPATWGKVGRNEPCPCGSGKKYKHCHGADGVPRAACEKWRRSSPRGRSPQRAKGLSLAFGRER